MWDSPCCHSEVIRAILCGIVHNVRAPRTAEAKADAARPTSDSAPTYLQGSGGQRKVKGRCCGGGQRTGREKGSGKAAEEEWGKGQWKGSGRGVGGKGNAKERPRKGPRTSQRTAVGGR